MLALQALSSSLNAGAAERGCLNRGKAALRQSVPQNGRVHLHIIETRTWAVGKLLRAKSSQLKFSSSFRVEALRSEGGWAFMNLLLTASAPILPSRLDRLCLGFNEAYSAWRETECHSWPIWVLHGSRHAQA